MSWPLSINLDLSWQNFACALLPEDFFCISSSARWMHWPPIVWCWDVQQPPEPSSDVASNHITGWDFENHLYSRFFRTPSCGDSKFVILWSDLANLWKLWAGNNCPKVDAAQATNSAKIISCRFLTPHFAGRTWGWRADMPSQSCIHHTSSLNLYWIWGFPKANLAAKNSKCHFFLF